MHAIIIHQNDRRVRDLLRKAKQQGGGSVTVNGRRLTHTLQVEELGSGTLAGKFTGGLLLGSAPRIARAIVGFADKVMTNTAEDVVAIQVIYMFHQSSGKAVRTIMRSMRRVRSDPDWQRLPFKHNKHLSVSAVVLLSCESATDKVAPNPVPPHLQRFVTQARLMRSVAGRSFQTPRSPPPITPPGIYDPQVITFSTGNAETGGVVLNPFNVQFRELAGHFDANGGWVWDDPNNHSGVPTSGTMYSDFVGSGSSSTTDVPSGQGANLMGYPQPGGPP